MENENTTSAQERRNEERVSGDTLVRFDGDNFSIYSRALDMSPSGAFVATHYLLDPGTEIDLHVIDRTGKDSRATARVVRTMSRTDERGIVSIGFGVEFLETFVAT